jgi:hypothetical protein
MPAALGRRSFDPDVLSTAEISAVVVLDDFGHELIQVVMAATHDDVGVTTNAFDGKRNFSSCMTSSFTARAADFEGGGSYCFANSRACTGKSRRCWIPSISVLSLVPLLNRVPGGNFTSQGRVWSSWASDSSTGLAISAQTCTSSRTSARTASMIHHRQGDQSLVSSYSVVFCGHGDVFGR